MNDLFESIPTELSAEELEKKIKFHNDKYWNKADPEISDEEFDELVRKLETIDPNNPILQKIYSPDVASLGKVKLKTPMLSLDKVYCFRDEDIPPREKQKGKKSLVKWMNNIKRTTNEMFIIQPKYDGISAIFADNILATRGDGEEGENITDKAPLIELETIEYKGKLDRETRGEIVIRNDDFISLYGNIKKKDGTPYKNSRNAAAGIMGLKDIGDILSQGAKLTFVDYTLVSYKIPFSQIETQWPLIIKEIEALPYPTDGIVIKIADEEYAKSLGVTAHHPRDQIAFKFSGMRMSSVIKKVEWSFGKNCLTPIANISPVEIGGITIQNVTLHNAGFVKKHDIQIGDSLVVERAGDVIPHMLSSSPGEKREPFLIENCPSCGTKLFFDDPELRCPNPECPETSLQKLLAAAKSIGIERLGEPTLRKIVSVLKVKKLKDIFNLNEDDFLKLDGFKEKAAKNLFREIQSAKNTTDVALLASLNIPGIGKHIAKSILQKYSLGELRKMSQEELEKIFGIGEERARELFEKFKIESEIIDELLTTLNVSFSKNSSNKSAPTICFTGKMPQKRSYYENLARENGFEITDSVTENLSLLVTADPSEKSSKIENAEKYGIKILSLSDWLANQTNQTIKV